MKRSEGSDNGNVFDGAGNSVLELIAERETEEAPGRKELLELLKKNGFMSADYYESLSGQQTLAGYMGNQPRTGGQLSSQTKALVEGINHVEKDYAEFKGFFAELDEFFLNPLEKPRFSFLNWITNFWRTAKDNAEYATHQLRKTANGKNRTLDVVLEDVTRSIEEVQQNSADTLERSRQVISDIVRYQEGILERRLAYTVRVWSNANSAMDNAQKLANRIAEHISQSTPSQYAAFSTAERNLARLEQHSAARMREAEVTACQDYAAQKSAHNLETAVKAEHERVQLINTQVAQTVQEVAYTRAAAVLLQDLYTRNAEMLVEVAKGLRAVIGQRITIINEAAEGLNSNLRTAVLEYREIETAKQSAVTESLAVEAEIAAQSGYVTMRQEAIRIFAERGAAAAKRMVYE